MKGFVNGKVVHDNTSTTELIDANSTLFIIEIVSDDGGGVYNNEWENHIGLSNIQGGVRNLQ